MIPAGFAVVLLICSAILLCCHAKPEISSAPATAGRPFFRIRRSQKKPLRPSFDDYDNIDWGTASSGPGGEVRYERRSYEDFMDRFSRKNFIRKVYAILIGQVTATAGVTAVIMKTPALQHFLFSNYKAVFATSFLGSTALVMTLCSRPRLRHTAPVNYVLLGVYTLLQAVMVGVYASLVSPRKVCLGSMHTLSVFSAITIYSFQPNPRWDLSAAGNTLLATLVSLTVGTILTRFFDMPMLDNFIYGACAVLFGVYVMHDTQKIVGGKHVRYQYSQREYILAALTLYQDLLNLFYQIMHILTKQDRKERS
jgi:FtsH-binding integral membrane protein